MILTTCLRVKGHTKKAISLSLYISLKENATLEALSNDGNLVIKKADKGDAVVVWAKKMYVRGISTA